MADWTRFGYSTSGRSHKLVRVDDGFRLRPTISNLAGTCVILAVGPLFTAFAVYGGDGDQWHELNLVLRNDTRLHLTAQGNRPEIEADAATLASFLNIPIWTGEGLS